jgi:hypothetical protein
MVSELFDTIDLLTNGIVYTCIPIHISPQSWQFCSIFSVQSISCLASSIWCFELGEITKQDCWFPENRFRHPMHFVVCCSPQVCLHKLCWRGPHILIRPLKRNALPQYSSARNRWFAFFRPFNKPNYNCTTILYLLLVWFTSFFQTERARVGAIK